MPNTWGRVNWGAPTWSPGGGLLAFPGGSPSQGWLGIFLATPAGRRLHPIALVKIPNTSNHFPQEVRWSPRGTKVVWGLRYDDSLPALYVSDARRRGRRRIVRRGIEPAWAPDGGVIAYAGLIGIHLVRPDGRADRRLTSGRFDQFPSWSPDSKYVAFTRPPTSAALANGGVYVVRKDGTGMRQLTSGASANPMWSPDGRQIAYVVVNEKGGSVIHVIDVDGTADRALTTSWEVGAERWSPNGQLLVFNRLIRENDFSEDPSIAVIARDGSGGEKFVAQAGDSSSPTWSPDGRRIAYSGEVPRCFAVFVVNAAGGGSKQVSPCRYAGP